MEHTCVAGSVPACMQGCPAHGWCFQRGVCWPACMHAHVVPDSPNTGRDCFPADSIFQLVVHVRAMAVLLVVAWPCCFVLWTLMQGPVLRWRCIGTGCCLGWRKSPLCSGYNMCCARCTAQLMTGYSVSCALLNPISPPCMCARTWVVV